MPGNIPAYFHSSLHRMTEQLGALVYVYYHTEVDILNQQIYKLEIPKVAVHHFGAWLSRYSLS